MCIPYTRGIVLINPRATIATIDIILYNLIQRSWTKILHNGSESGSEWHSDLASNAQSEKSHAKIHVRRIYTYGGQITCPAWHFRFCFRVCKMLRNPLYSHWWSCCRLFNMVEKPGDLAHPETLLRTIIYTSAALYIIFFGCIIL